MALPLEAIWREAGRDDSRSKAMGVSAASPPPVNAPPVNARTLLVDGLFQQLAGTLLRTARAPAPQRSKTDDRWATALTDHV